MHAVSRTPRFLVNLILREANIAKDEINALADFLADQLDIRAYSPNMDTDRIGAHGNF